MGNIKIIIMTESSKFSAKCVAGINVSNGKWVRLVSGNEKIHGAISNEDLLCKDGRICTILDIVNVPIMGTCGSIIQPENVLIDKSKYIKFEGSATLKDVLRLHPAEVRDTILGNKYSYITEQGIKTVGYSLTLVEVVNLEIIQTQTSDGKMKTKANFTYQGDNYKMMSVTDPRFYSMPNGTVYNRAFLVISIGTPYNDKYYKFVSGIFLVI